MKLTFSFFLISSTLFLVQISHVACAQKGNSNTPTQRKLNQTNQSVALVDPDEPQLENGSTLAEGKKMKENYLVWKMYTIDFNCIHFPH